MPPGVDWFHPLGDTQRRDLNALYCAYVLHYTPGGASVLAAESLNSGYNIHNRIIQENRAAFDIDGDGDVDLDDALTLASLIEIPSSPFTSISLEEKRAVLSPDVELNVALDRAPKAFVDMT